MSNACTQRAYDCLRESGKCQGILQCLESGHPVLTLPVLDRVLFSLLDASTVSHSRCVKCTVYCKLCMPVCSIDGQWIALFGRLSICTVVLMSLVVDATLHRERWNIVQVEHFSLNTAMLSGRGLALLLVFEGCSLGRVVKSLLNVRS